MQPRVRISGTHSIRSRRLCPRTIHTCRRRRAQRGRVSRHVSRRPRPRSSEGQSSGLLIRRSQVRILPGAQAETAGQGHYPGPVAPSDQGNESSGFTLTGKRRQVSRTFRGNLRDAGRLEPSSWSRWDRDGTVVRRVPWTTCSRTGSPSCAARADRPTPSTATRRTTTATSAPRSGRSRSGRSRPSSCRTSTASTRPGAWRRRRCTRSMPVSHRCSPRRVGGDGAVRTRLNGPLHPRFPTGRRWCPSPRT